MLLIFSENPHGLLQRYYKYQCFSKNFKGSNRKQNKTWVDKGSEFYNRSMKSWLGKK